MARLWNWPPVISLAPNVIRSLSLMREVSRSAIVVFGMMENRSIKNAKYTVLRSKEQEAGLSVR